MIGPDKIHAIPWQVQWAMNQISGFLTCRRCGDIIIGDGTESKQAIYPNPEGEEAIAAHVCIQDRETNVDWLLSKGVAFPYDFNSPMTVKEQLAQYIDDMKKLNKKDANALAYALIPTDATPPHVDIEKATALLGIPKHRQGQAEESNTTPPLNARPTRPRTLWDE